MAVVLWCADKQTSRRESSIEESIFENAYRCVLCYYFSSLYRIGSKLRKKW